MKKMGTKNKRRRGVAFLLLFLCLIQLLTACGGDKPAAGQEGQAFLLQGAAESSQEVSSAEELGDIPLSSTESQGEEGSSEEEMPPAQQQGLDVHYIDVGEGESILIQTDGGSILIDAGDKEHGGKLVSYLRGQGVQSLELVVATHPHDDHIGGMTAVLEAFPVKQLLLSDVTHTTPTFEHFIDSISQHHISAVKASVGQTFTIGGASLQVVGPYRIQPRDLNNDSVGIRMTFGKNRFLFTGDAEKSEETDMMSQDLQADVLSVGHHGSKTSTSSPFLSAVSPSAAVISCGKGNRYGHPSQETLDRLRAAGVNIYRTDMAGTIVAHSDGETIHFNVSPDNEGVAGRVEKKEKSSSSAASSIAEKDKASSSTEGKSSTGKVAEKKADKTSSAPSSASSKSNSSPSALSKSEAKSSQPAKKKQKASPSPTPARSSSYVGNASSKIFHRSSCSSVKKMSANNRLSFSSRQEAISGGFRPCKRCRP